MQFWRRTIRVVASQSDRKSVDCVTSAQTLPPFKEYLCKEKTAKTSYEEGGLLGKMLQFKFVSILSQLAVLSVACFDLLLMRSNISRRVVTLLNWMLPARDLFK